MQHHLGKTHSVVHTAVCLPGARLRPQVGSRVDFPDAPLLISLVRGGANEYCTSGIIERDNTV